MHFFWRKYEKLSLNNNSYSNLTRILRYILYQKVDVMIHHSISVVPAIFLKILKAGSVSHQDFSGCIPATSVLPWASHSAVSGCIYPAGSGPLRSENQFKLYLFIFVIYYSSSLLSLNLKIHDVVAWISSLLYLEEQNINSV